MKQKYRIKILRKDGSIITENDFNTLIETISYCRINQINLRYANFCDADLSGVNLSDTDLRYADLSDANLSDANLSGANLRYVNLSNANLNGANLNCADLDFSSLPLSCSGLELKMDKRQIIQLLFHTASNMQFYLKNNNDPVLEKIYIKIHKIQDQFHKKEEVNALKDIKDLRKLLKGNISE